MRFRRRTTVGPYRRTCSAAGDPRRGTDHARWALEQRLHRAAEKTACFMRKSLARLFSRRSDSNAKACVGKFSQRYREPWDWADPAAIGGATIRALDRCFELGLDDEARQRAGVSKGEKIAHGDAIGIFDNTPRLPPKKPPYGQTMLFRSGESPLRKVNRDRSACQVVVVFNQRCRGA